MIDALTNLDKSSWEKHRFDEIAMMVSERVDPNNTDLEIYVGLEHLDSESLHIRSHGTADDVNGTKLRFYKGDVIFGRRRAYQRKAAIAEYDGFCSAHALVLRAKPKVIDPALFPFFLHSDQFMHRAVDISVGSLSPTINWKSLRKEKFLLPPKAEQARLAELLWAGDGVVEGLEKTILRLLMVSRSYVKGIFEKERCNKVKLSSISNNLDSKRIPIKSSSRTSGPYPYYGATGIVDYVEGYIYDEPILLISEDGENLNSRKYPIAYSVDEKCWVNNHSHVLSFKSDEIRQIVRCFFNQADISKFLTSGTRPKINKGILMAIPLYLPKYNYLKKDADGIFRLESLLEQAKSSVASTCTLQKSLINQIF